MKWKKDNPNVFPCVTKYKTEREAVGKYSQINAMRAMVAKNIKDGNIEKLPCVICGDEKSFGHHF